MTYEPSMIFRIYTEDVENAKQLAEIVSRFFDGFTVFETHGFWKGEYESSAVVEIHGKPGDVSRVRVLAEEIRKVNKQEVVRVVKIRAESVVDVGAEVD